jgi:hypothetical protein
MKTMEQLTTELNFDTTVHIERDELRVAFEWPKELSIQERLEAALTKHFTKHELHVYPLSTDETKVLYVMIVALSERNQPTTFGQEMLEMLQQDG